MYDFVVQLFVLLILGDIEAPDRETERRTQEKQKEITFQNGVDGNICSYFFSTRVTET